MATEIQQVDDNEIVLVDDWDYLEKATKIYATYAKNQNLRK